MSWLKRFYSLGGGTEPDRLIFLLLAFAVLVIAWSHIFHQLGVPSLWIDEAVSWDNSSGSWSQLYQKAIYGQDCGGIVFSSFLKLWIGVFGSSELSLRVPSGLATIGFVALMMRVGLLLWGRRAGLYVGLIASLNTGTLMYARESRAYAFLLALTAVAFLGLATYWLRSRRQGFWILWIACPLIVMTHVFGIFVVAGMTGAQMMLWWGTSTRPRPLAGLLGATGPLLFSLVLSVGWSLLMQTRIELIMESFWTTEAAVGSLLSSYRSVLDEWAWIAIGVLSMLFRQGQPSRRGAAIAIVTVAATVTVGPGLVSFLTEGGHHFVFPRYLLAVVPCAALAGGFALSRMGWVPGIACILWIFWVPLVQPNMRLYSPTAHYGHDTRSASILLANRTREGDEIAVLPSWNYLTFEYYGFNVPVRGDAVWTLLNRWNAGEIRNRLWIVDYDGRLARSARFERLGGCTHQRLYGIDFYLCKS